LTLKKVLLGWGLIEFGVVRWGARVGESETSADESANEIKSN